MAGSDQAMPGASSRLGQMVQLVVKALLARSPAYVWRVLRVAFSPSLILRKLALCFPKNIVQRQRMPLRPTIFICIASLPAEMAAAF